MTRFIDDTGGPRIIRDFNSSEDFTVQNIARDVLISGGSVVTSDVKDANTTVTSGAVVDHDFDVNVILPLPVNNFPTGYTITNLTPGIVTFTGNSANRVSDGVARYNVTAYLGTKQSTFAVLRQSGQTITQFNNWVTGSLAQVISDSTDALIAGKTPGGSTQNIFIGFPHGFDGGGRAFPITGEGLPNIYTNNTNLFTYSSGIDTSSITTSDGGGVVVTQQHVIQAAHYTSRDMVGRSLYFVDHNNICYQRSIVSGAQVGVTDIWVSKLNMALPASIKPAKVLPANWNTKLASLQTGIPLVFRIPVICTNQNKQFFIQDIHLNQLANAGSGLVRFDYFTTPTNSQRLAFYLPIITGDSGSPQFLNINNQLVVLATQYTGGTNPSIADYITETNAVITSLGGGGSLSIVDLSSFPSY